MKIFTRSTLNNLNSTPVFKSVVLAGVLAAFFSMNSEYRNNSFSGFQALGISSASAQSEVAQMVMDVCIDKAENDKWFAGYFADTVHKLETENMNYIESLWIVNTGLAGALNSGLGALVGLGGYQHASSVRADIDRKREASHTQAQSQYEKDVTACSEAALQLDRELSVVDTSERNIRFNYQSGAVSFGLASIPGIPRGTVTAEPFN